jgi:N-acetylneuraminic acid mutarotase
MVTQHYFVILFGRTQQWNRWKESKDIWVLDLTGKGWNKMRIAKDANNRGLYGHTASLIGDKIFIFGGYAGDLGNCTNAMSVLSTASIRDAFHSLPITELVPDTPAPSPRYGHSAIVFENKIFIFGGNNRTETFNDVFEYDISANAWRKPAIGRLSPPGMPS